MKNLIVSADDFGFHKSINEGIAKARKEGIVTSLNLMPTGGAFEDAVRLIKEMDLKEIGAHLSLTETSPSLDAGKVPTLVAKDGRFHRNHTAFFLNFFLKKIDLLQVYLELKNQLDCLQRVGARITNLTSHENIHMVPHILDIFVRLAKEHNIPSMRRLRKEKLPAHFSPRRLYKKSVISYFEKGMGDILNRYGIAATDHFLGFLDAGNIREDSLLVMLDSLEDGTTELMTHPGFLSPEVLDKYKAYLNCEAELAALVSRRVKRLIQNKGIKLVTYGEFLKTKGI